CEGCGCEFILPPDQISFTCVYCGSPHVVDWKSEEDLLAPDGIIPHAFDQDHAGEILAQWIESNQIEPEVGAGSPTPYDPRGVYLPLWTFDLGGELDYIGETVDDSEVEFGRRQPKMIRVNDSYPVQINDL